MLKTSTQPNPDYLETSASRGPAALSLAPSLSPHWLVQSRNCGIFSYLKKLPHQELIWVHRSSGIQRFPSPPIHTVATVQVYWCHLVTFQASQQCPEPPFRPISHLNPARILCSTTPLVLLLSILYSSKSLGSEHPSRLLCPRQSSSSLQAQLKGLLNPYPVDDVLLWVQHMLRPQLCLRSMHILVQDLSLSAWQ